MMMSTTSLLLLLPQLLLLLSSLSSLSQAAAASSSPLWVRRNVKDLGAVGDGVHDDTAAFILALTQEKATINASLTDPTAPWNASQYNCQTTKPSIVVVPPGTYRITQTLPLTFYSQLVGRNYTTPDTRPVLKFEGAHYHCLDAGIDEGFGHGWFGNVNQNNFYHQVRNIIVDATDCFECVGIHWEVSQATNLVNVDLLLGSASQGNTGVLMECGSGGYFGDVAVYGGKIGMAIGNQQFTLRNITVIGAETAISMFWNWVWAFHDVYIANSTYGFVFTSSVRSVSLVDVTIEHTTIGVFCNDTPPTSLHPSTNSFLPTQILLDAVTMSNDVTVPLIINGSLAINDASTAYQFTYARLRNGSFFAGPIGSMLPARPAGLLMKSSTPSTSKWFGMTRPDYNPDDASQVATLLLENFTDVTATLQAALNLHAATDGKAIFVPFGTYFISDTVVLPTGTRLFGEAWTRFAPIGSKFGNASTPRAMFQVGQPNDVGVAQLADLMFTNHGPAPGAILVSWFTAGAQPGDCGIWDVHYRIGGAMDTDTNVTLCNVNVTYDAAPDCAGVHTMLHIQPNASVYVENVWGWTADHHIDFGNSLNIFNARGFVVETTAPVWLYGTAMEHSFMFQYNLVDSRQTLLSIIQTETAYYQPQFALVKQTAADPLYPDWQWHGFSIVAQRNQGDTVLYGAGMYSFFYHWSTAKCGADPLYCQSQISSWTFDPWRGGGGSGGGKATTRLHNFNTHAAKYVVQWDLVETPAVNVTNGFCDTISVWNGV